MSRDIYHLSIIEQTLLGLKELLYIFLKNMYKHLRSFKVILEYMISYAFIHIGINTI